MTFEPIYRRSFDAAELARRYPPAFSHPNKVAAYQAAMAGGPAPSGTIALSQWPAMELPGAVGPASTRVELRPDTFQYEPPETGEAHWHLNFANFDIFAYYAGPLLAQDELQVVEHPALASVRHTLLEDGLSTLVVEDGAATPILVAGVERRCRLETRPGVGGNPAGLYGNNFAVASEAAVRGAVMPLRPPTRSNILAIEAPAYGSGRYAPEEIAFILRTAFSGFAAARAETAHLHGGEPLRLVIHTGFWGCGAYGGNRHLMTVLQIVAAEAAGIDRLVYHTVDRDGLAPAGDAAALADEMLSGPRRTEELIDAIDALGFEWGVGDGT